jgi:hypothetical protein
MSLVPRAVTGRITTEAANRVSRIAGAARVRDGHFLFVVQPGHVRATTPGSRDHAKAESEPSVPPSALSGHFEARSFALHYARPMAAAATLIMWFYLRSPELAEDFERLMASDRDVVGGSLDTMSDWRLTRPMDVPGQASESADYVLIAEIHNIQRWQQQAEARVDSLEDDLAHLVSSRKMLVLQRIL